MGKTAILPAWQFKNEFLIKSMLYQYRWNRWQPHQLWGDSLLVSSTSTSTGPYRSNSWEQQTTPPDNPWSYRWKNWHIWPGWWNKASRWWNWRRPDKYFEWTYFHSLEIIWSFNFPFYQLFFISLLYMCCQRWMKDYRSLLYRNPDSTQIRTLNSTIASQAFVHVALVIFLKFVPVVLTKSSL